MQVKITEASPPPVEGGAPTALSRMDENTKRKFQRFRFYCV